MTPAPISVERLRELIAEYWDLAYAEGAESRSHDTPAGDAMRVSAEIDKCIAVLLQQLAEREADLEREQGVREDAQRQLRAAERAREEATGLLREVEPEINELSNIYYSEFSNTKRERETEALHSRIAAFLAASGGSHG